MKSAIVDSIPTGLVYMDKAFSAINQIQSEYNWLITELNYLADNEDVLGHYWVFAADSATIRTAFGQLGA